MTALNSAAHKQTHAEQINGREGAGSDLIISIVC